MFHLKRSKYLFFILNRLRSLQDNHKDDGTVNLNLSDTEKLWKNFDLQRTGVVDEICGNRNGTTDCLTDKENTSLEKIANVRFIT